MNFLLLNGNGDYFLIDTNSFLLIEANYNLNDETVDFDLISDKQFVSTLSVTKNIITDLSKINNLYINLQRG